MKRRRAVVVVTGLVATALVRAVLRWRRNSSAYLYELSFSLELPRPFITRPRLREILAPKPGERVLEVGVIGRTLGGWRGVHGSPPGPVWSPPNAGGSGRT